MLKLSKVVDKQIWDFEHPLRQFEGMTFEILQKLEAKKLTMDRMKDMEPSEIGNVLVLSIISRLLQMMKMTMIIIVLIVHAWIVHCLTYNCRPR